MSELIRFGDSMDGRLLARFDQLIDEKGDFKPVRGIKDLIRDEVVEHFYRVSHEVIFFISNRILDINGTITGSPIMYYLSRNIHHG